MSAYQLLDVGERVIMAGFLDGAEIEIPCEKCGRKTKKSIGWIKTHGRFTCSCGTEISIDASQFKAEIAKAERSVASLQSALKNLGK